MRVRYNHMKEDLEKIIIKRLFDLTQLDEAIKQLVSDTLEQTINFDTPDSDHKKVNPPNDSIIKFSEDIEPLDEFTKLRRRVYKILFGSEARIFEEQEKLKTEAVSSVKTTKELSSDDKIHINVSNNSRLVQFLSRGEIPSMLKSETDLEQEYRGMFFKARDLYGDFENYPRDVRKYIGVLGQVIQRLGGENLTYELNHETVNVSPRIVPRRVLHASTEQVGKEFIKNNIV